VTPHHHKPPSRKPSPVDAVRQGFARRRERNARIRLRRGTGQPVVLADDDPRADGLLEAAEALISASQRASKRT
jgi:hypothetical protein